MAADDETPPPLRLKIKRRPSAEAPPWWQELEVPFDEQKSLLDALRTVADLAVAEPCADQKCGQCAMLLNGEPLLACRTKHGDLEEPIEARALTQLGGTTDLLIDRDAIRARSGELPAAGCIDCGLCLEVCPSFDRQRPFSGPAALYRAEAARAAKPAAWWECDNVGNCSAVCPEQLPIADAIAALKRRADSP